MQYLVDFTNNASSDAIQQYLTSNSCAVVQVWNNFEKVYLVESTTELPTTDIIESIVLNEQTIIKPLTCFTTGVVDFDPYADVTYNPSYPSITINTKEQKDWWKNYSLMTPEFEKDTVTINRKGKNISVYIMDSGIRSNHPEFDGVDISYIYSVTPNDFVDNNGHGTAIASIIAGNICGITQSKLKIVKIFDAGHSTLLSEMLSALDSIINDVPLNTFAVVNCSWAIAKNLFIENKMKFMIERGIYIVASAGNNGSSIEDVTPASMPEVMTIGSYNSNLLPSDFSNFTGQSHISNTENEVNSGELDGWAPGEEIYSAKLNDQLGFASGTSMACAVASAVLAYNLESYSMSDGTRISGYEETPLLNQDKSKTEFSSLCIRRPDIINLTDEKYQSSKNMIVTLTDLSSFNITSPEGRDERVGYYYVGDVNWRLQVFSPSQAKYVELITPLPENFCINSRGLIQGIPSVEQGPQNNEPYNLLISKIKIEWKTGYVEEITLKLYIIKSKEEVLTNTEIPNDHELKIQLQTAQCFSSPQVVACFIQGYYVDCATTCYVGGCCYPAYGKSAACYCA